MKPNPVNLILRPLLALGLLAAAGRAAGIACACGGQLHHVDHAVLGQALGADGSFAFGVEVETAVGIEIKPAGERDACLFSKQEEKQP